MTELKKADTKLVVKFCLSDFAKGIFTGMIANFLLTFLMPTNTSGITPYIHQGIILGFITFIGLIKALGHVLDAVTDPLIANMSDKCKNKNGRRMPFMRWTALPFGLSALLIFCPPMPGIHWLNDVWVAFFIFSYFFFYTTYEIPHGALFPELITDHKTRLTAYTISSLCFVAGSAVVYMTPLFVSILGKSSALTTNQAYQITFALFTAIGIVLLFVTAFSFKEKEYVESNIPSIKLFPALKSAFKNKQFKLVTVGQLFEIVSMAFFQATIFYDIDVLLGLNGGQAAIVMGVSIFGSVLLYPLVVKISKKYGKKIPLVAALIWFVVAYIIICLVGNMPGNKLVIGVLFGLFVSYPFAALNILPNAIMSDVIQYDTLKTGENKEGIFSAARSFITKMGQSIAIMFVPSLVQIGHTEGVNVTATGLRVTALVSAFFCVISVVVFLLYNNKSVIAYIEEHRKKDAPAVDETSDIYDIAIDNQAREQIADVTESGIGSVVANVETTQQVESVEKEESVVAKDDIIATEKVAENEAKTTAKDISDNDEKGEKNE
ncbi:MAG: MFS transporter [Clostridia bacterium]